MQSKLKADLKKKYQELFAKYEIAEQTGQLGYDPTRKFATYPYIGSRYGEAAKILVVGLDIGKDETCGRFQSFEERRAAIEDKELRKHNPHIAGTYFTALFFLKNKLDLKGKLEWQESWIKTKNASTCQQALKNRGNLPTHNPLSYIALTNYYKFVKDAREGRAGGSDRIYLDRRFDQNFFIEEVEIFTPDIVIFQSEDFNAYKYEMVWRDVRKAVGAVYVGPHPSYRKKGGRVPENLVKRILDGKL